MKQKRVDAAGTDYEGFKAAREVDFLMTIDGKPPAAKSRPDNGSGRSDGRRPSISISIDLLIRKRSSGSGCRSQN